MSPDIRRAARSSAIVVILMAMSRLEMIMDIFKESGKSNTPVAIIQDATPPTKKNGAGKVKDIVFKAAHARLCNPTVIIVGEVVTLHPSLLPAQITNIASLYEAV